MRKLFPLLSVAVLFSGVALVWAAEEKTVSGEGQCAKCSLRETKACQNAIVTEEGICRAPYETSLAAAVGQATERRRSGGR